MQGLYSNCKNCYIPAGSLFPYLKNNKKFQLLVSPIDSILKNRHACNYDNLTMNYFNIILSDNLIYHFLNRIVI